MDYGHIDALEFRLTLQELGNCTLDFRVVHSGQFLLRFWNDLQVVPDECNASDLLRNTFGSVALLLRCDRAKEADASRAISQF